MFASQPKDAAFDSRLLIDEVRAQFKDEPWRGHLVVVLHQAMTRRPRLPIILNSFLPTIVSAFEALMANVATEYYRSVPEALEAVPREKEKEFSLKDLKRLESIDAAIEVAVASRVDDLTFGGLGDWRRFFKDNLKTDFADLVPDWPALQEVFQRRHAIVHHGGRASRKYVRAVRELGPAYADVEPGDLLDSNEDYISTALDGVQALGILLAAAVWRKLFRNEDIPTLLVRNEAYNALRAERWDLAEALATYALTTEMEQDDAWLTQVNRWIARSRRDGTESIRAEVESWDVSALQEKFQLAKACLLGQVGNAFMLLNVLVSRLVVSEQDLAEWPLLAPLREDPRYERLQQEARSAARELEAATLLVMTAGKRTVHYAACRRAPTSARPVTLRQVASRAGVPCGICSPLIDAEAAT